MKKQIKLKNLIEEKQLLNEGFISNLITNLIVLIMSPTRKKLDSMIDPQARKRVVSAAQELKNAIDRYNKLLQKPDVKKDIEDSGMTVDDFYIDKI